MSGIGNATESSVDLAEAYVNGEDPEAAYRLYHKHRDATLKLAADGMSHRLQVRVDPEDVYQSVSLILFRGLKKGRFHLTRTGDLRALLAMLTQRRIQKKVEQNTAEKRSLIREIPLRLSSTLSAKPSVEHFALEEQEEISSLFSRLRNTDHRKILQLALAGMPLKDIASTCNCSAARVRQNLTAIARQVIGLNNENS